MAITRAADEAVDAAPAAEPERHLGPIARHPLGAFFGLAFGISWAAFVPAAAFGADALVLLGAFGPAAAAAVVTHATGGSVRAWLRGMWRWRTPLRFYAFALGLPPLLVALTIVGSSAAGEHFRLDPPGTVVAGYLTTVALVAVLGGGQEEPGWRGFALARLEQRFGAVGATVVLGFVWGAWHLPVYGLGGFVGPLLFVVFYTWLYDRTQSVAACVLLHSSFNTALGYLELADHGATVPVVLVITTAAAAVALVAATGLPGPRSHRGTAVDDGR